jgi:hypothetical protein
MHLDKRSARQKQWFGDKCLEITLFLSSGSRRRSHFYFFGAPRQTFYAFKAFFERKTGHYKTAVKVPRVSFFAHGPVSKSFFENRNRKNDFETGPCAKNDVWGHFGRFRRGFTVLFESTTKPQGEGENRVSEGKMLNSNRVFQWFPIKQHEKYDKNRYFRGGGKSRGKNQKNGPRAAGGREVSKSTTAKPQREAEFYSTRGQSAV